MFHDPQFFFKYSSARREDYKGMEELTNVTAEFAKKHVDTRWLSVKLACVRVLEQWDNLCEYFLTFLPHRKKYLARNITYYAIQKNQSSFGEHNDSSLHFILFIL